MADPWQEFRVAGEQPAQPQVQDPWAAFRVQDDNVPAERGAGAFAAPPTLKVPESAGQSLLRGWHENELAAIQGVNPHATSKYFANSPENKPQRLGLMEEFDNGPMYKGPTGEYLRINPQTDFVAPDPDSPGQMAVYARTPQTNEKWYESASRLIAPWMATGPVAGAARTAVQQIAERAPGLLNDPLKAEIATSRAAELGRDVRAFDRAQVPKPPVAFMEGPAQGVTRQLADLPLPMNPIKGGLDKSLRGAADATDRLADAYGAAQTREAAGTTVREGIERFKDARPDEIVERTVGLYTPDQINQIIAAPARDTSMKTKQAALYQRAWSSVPPELQNNRIAQMRNTQEVINGIIDRNLGMMNQQRAANGLPPAEAMPIRGGMLGDIVEQIATGHWTGTLQDMRNIRSDIRRLSSGISDTEKNVLRSSDVEAIRSAVTRDMTNYLRTGAETYREIARRDPSMAQEALRRAANADRAAREFQQADTFTRLASQRMERIQNLFNAKSDEALYDSILNAARAKKGGDLERLRILRRTLRPEEMNDVASAVIRQLGEPVGSARGAVQEMGFSPSSALTRWNNMSPEGRALIFGTDHAQALDDWFRVVNRLANVEAHANTSKSGVFMQNVLGALTAGGLAVSGHTALLAGGAGTAYALMTLLSRPAYTRWLTQYANMRAAALRAPGLHNNAVPIGTINPRLVVMANQIQRMALRDPELIPIAKTVADENGISKRSQEKQ